jgi:serine/threonine protein kinase
MALPSGTKLGGYEIIAPLGAGGMGEVYRARDPQLGRDVAIKILPSFLSRDADRLRRFEQEARAAAALNHPNILVVYQFGSHDGAPYLVSELLEGHTLREILMRGPVAVRKAVDYAIQTAHGLAAAHEKGIVHRDLKPENLFLTKDGRIKILDFGLAKVIDTPRSAEPTTPTMTEGTEPGVVLGTAGYMAPEQVRGDVADGRADLFALGSILHEMLTGKRAFHKPTSAETMSAILNEEPPPISQLVPSIPPALQKVVHRCLEKTPQQRFHSASDLAFALEALSDSGSGSTAPFTAARTGGSKFWLVAAGVAAVMIIGLLWFLAGSTAGPVVESVVQLTNDGQNKAGSMEADASRIYFNEGTNGSFRVAQVSVNGGETGEVPTNVLNPEILGLTKDGSALLVSSGGFIQAELSMWLVPLPTGQARRLGDEGVFSARLFPDGRLLYLRDSGLFVADRDGSNPHRLDELSKYKPMPRSSPDGQQLVFRALEENAWTIYEAAADGTNVHPVLKWHEGLPRNACCVRWNEDGKSLIFRAQTEGRWDLWALPTEKPLFRRKPVPVRLTNGPISYTAFAPSRDGKKIFATGALLRGEMQRYDDKSGQFAPFLGGISAVDPTFSRDGKWVAYLAYPEGTLWRSRPDGSERMQLTYPPTDVGFERISPDGSRIAFSDAYGATYLIGINGGTPKKLADLGTAPDWSPDGNLLVVTGYEGNSYVQRFIDVRDGSIKPVPDSKDTIGGWFTGPDSFIAVSGDQSKFVRFDMKSQKWSDVVTNPDKFVNWETSPDLRYFVYSTGGQNPTIYRLRLADNKIEPVVNIKNFHGVGDAGSGPGLSAAPDGSVLVTRNVGTEEVYAISVKWP